METILFVAFVVVFGLIIFLPVHKSKKQTELKRRHSVKKTARQSDLLTQPTDHLMAHRREVWQKRQRKVKRDATARPDFIPQFEKANQEQYDGYSRRGRHHLTPEAQAKHAGKKDEFTMTAVKFEPDPELKATGSGKS